MSGIKFAVPGICLKIVDRRSMCTGAGMSDDFSLAMMWAGLRTMRIADGADEAHKLSVARQKLRRQRKQPSVTASATVGA